MNLMIPAKSLFGVSPADRSSEKDPIPRLDPLHPLSNCLDNPGGIIAGGERQGGQPGVRPGAQVSLHRIYPDGANLYHHLLGTCLGVWDFFQFHHLGGTEFVDANRFHGFLPSNPRIPIALRNMGRLIFLLLQLSYCILTWKGSS
jgi:hypothetical protein